MPRWCYTAVYTLLIPLILLRLLYRGLRARGYWRRIHERFGLFRAPFSDCIWIHAVSVGELIAAEPLIRQIQKSHPKLPLVVTTMTPTGSAQVIQRFGQSVFHVYAPYDLPGSVLRFLRKLKPRLLIVMETELWPNILHYCARRDIPVVLANARLSERSARGYQRFAGLTRPMLSNLALVIAQHEADAERFRTLGLPEGRLVTTGSIKFDVELSPQLKSEALRQRAVWQSAGPRLIWIAASTHEGEDALLLAAHRQLLDQVPDALLILVPRHPERFDQVAALIQAAGLQYQRRSQGQVLASESAVLLGDTMGELLLLYGCADIAFIGGSLVDHGGHNMLEAAAWSLPIVTGWSCFNFQAISDLLEESQALVKVDNEAELADVLIRWAQLPAERERAGAAALSVVRANRGALKQVFEAIRPFLKRKKKRH